MTVILSRGDKGPAVEKLQKNLNKVGAMLEVDSDYGVATERGVKHGQSTAGFPITGKVNQQLLDWVEAQQDPFPQLANEGVAFLAREETGGLAYYDLVAKAPHYPGESSGITIGVGFDLRYQSRDTFETNWSAYLTSSVINELIYDIGRRGTKKRVAELKSMGIEIPFTIAWNVFLNHTLPNYYDLTQTIYPSLPDLPMLCSSALVSLVYNRGASLSGSRRKEMKSIQSILEKASDGSLNNSERKQILLDIENEFVQMRRLWPLNTGLGKRRQEEANLWRRGLAEL